MTTETADRVLRTVKETAAILRVHPQTVYREIWRGNLGHERVGGKVLVSDEHLSNYRGENSYPAHPKPAAA